MRNLLVWFGPLGGKLENAIQLTAGGLMAASMLFAGYEVAMRYWFNSAHDWGDELILFLALTSSLIGGATLGKKHVRIDLLLTYLGTRAVARLELFNNLMTLVGCLFLFWANIVAIRFLAARNLTTPTLRWPAWLPFLAVCLAMIVCAIYSLREILKTFVPEREPRT